MSKQKVYVQTYEVTVSLAVTVPDDWTDEDTAEHFSDFPIIVNVEPEPTEHPEGVSVDFSLDGVTTLYGLEEQ